MFKKVILSFLFLFLFLTLFCCGCGKKTVHEDTLSQIESRGKLIVGVKEDTAPFGYRDKNGNIIGFDIDIARNIAKTILGNENKLELVPVNDANRILKLSSGEIDILIATMSITSQRLAILDFSSPYYIAGQAIMVKNSSKETSLNDFKNKKLIVVFGSTSEKNIRTNVPEVDVIGYKTYPEAFSALKANKANGIIADDSILYGLAMNDNSVKILPKRYTQEPYAITFRKDNDSTRLVSKVNSILTELENTKQLEKLKEKWNIKK